MPWILGIIGALVGAFCADADRALFGLLSGSLIGVLSGSHLALRRRIDELAQQLARRERIEAAVARPSAPAEPTPASAPVAASAAAPDPSAQAAAPANDRAPTTPATGAPPPPRPVAARAPSLASARAMDPVVPAPATAAVPPAGPTLDERITGTLRRWLFEGNLPVKFGLVVLFFGIAAGLKYAIDEGYVALPIEWRFIGIAIGALAFLAWGWTQRSSRPVFGLSMQGGAIGVLLLTVFAAFRLYDLLAPEAAFALIIVLVAGGALLAVLQDTAALAVLAFIGGYLAPVLISTGSGDHVALFSYYAVLNLAVLGVAWFRPWRALNLVGFLFTFIIGAAWGAKYYKPELFNSVEPFLVGFFLFYLAIPLFYALRTREQTRGFVDSTLVFGTPLLAFPLQAALLVDDRMGLAWSALVVSAIYALLAAALIRREGMRLLAQSFAVLAAGFASVAVPLALSSRWTSAVWALQGAALVWLGLRQQRLLPKLAGWLLQLLAAGAYVASVFDGGWGPQVADLPLLNGHLLGLLCMVIGALLVSWLHERAGAGRLLVWPPFLLGLLWWVVAGVREIDVYGEVWRDDAPPVAFAMITLLLAALLRGLLGWARLGWAAVFALLASVPLALLSNAISADGPLAIPEGPVWLAWLVAALFALRRLGWPQQSGLAWGHIAFLATLAIVLGGQGWASTSQSLDSGWSDAAAVLPLLVLAWAGWRMPELAGWPLGELFPDYANRWLALALPALGVLWLLGQAAAGNAEPLPFVPLFNPLELVQLLILLLLWAVIRNEPALAGLRLLLPVAAFVMLTVATLRGVHHLAAVPWSASILDSRIAQTALTVVWSIAGVTAWVLGSKRLSRPLWIAGALLMGVVLGKLVLVDRSYIGNIAGIVSFVAVGLLLIAVGYLAPSPPRRAQEPV